MTRNCFVLALCVFALVACKKNNPLQPEPEITCNSVNFTGNDTATVALMTEYSSQGTRIVKLQNGTASTVASASNYEFWGPAISPDKQKFICFRSTTGNTVKVNDYENAELWMFDMDGSNGHMILSRTANGWLAMGMADWAPDGIHIVLAAEKTDLSDGKKHWNIYLTDTSGSTPVKMNTRVGRFTHPRFANGNMNLITYSAWPDGLSGIINEFRSEIYYATVNSSFQLTAEVQVTNDMYYDYAPVFSPDNSKICFAKTLSTVNLNGGSALYLYPISGSTSKLSTENEIDDNPYWCTVNGKIYCTSQTTAGCLNHVYGINLSTGINGVYFRQLNKHYYHISIK